MYGLKAVPFRLKVSEILDRDERKNSAGERFRSGATEGRKREGASTVSFNHPLAANLKGSWRNMRTLQYVFMALAVLCFAVPAFAQGGGSEAASLVPIGAGIGMAIAAGLCGLGQGRATASACEALARNPGARGGLMIFLILGLALIESLTLFTLVIILIKVK
jgi:F-type H+-transporting ATPase subunit c